MSTTSFIVGGYESIPGSTEAWPEAGKTAWEVITG